MKRFLLIGCILLIARLSFGQWSYEWLNRFNNKHLLYTLGDVVSNGSINGGNIGFSFVHKSNWCMQAGFAAASDNHPETGSVWLKSAVVNDLQEQGFNAAAFENYYLMLGRQFGLNKNGTIRLTLQGGPDMLLQKALAASQNQGGLASGNNPVPDLAREIGIMLNSKIEFPLTPLLGFSFGPTLIASRDTRMLAFGVGFIYGIITRN